MNKEEIYDYSKGLSAPYWIQEIRTKKGKLIASFSVPIQLSYFVVFALVLLLMLTVFRPVMDFIYLFMRGAVYGLYYFVPAKLAKWYSTYDVDGKPMLYFIRDWFRYQLDFGLNKKSIYQSNRQHIVENVVFEKIKL
ncbi:conjugal transfer protein [Streptococcus minor]|uniref:Conjugal transfer protein n=1 Tax=Streptococcus minor TaxID=229549 RepID=A0A3P1VBA8_9STRE|nr:conjugal transfer protein [Streptococcus minor]RRD31504.1 conjugal transfer protein [Streptococcus minor]